MNLYKHLQTCQPGSGIPLALRSSPAGDTPCTTAKLLLYLSPGILQAKPFRPPTCPSHVVPPPPAYNLLQSKQMLATPIDTLHCITLQKAIARHSCNFQAARGKSPWKNGVPTWVPEAVAAAQSQVLLLTGSVQLVLGLGAACPLQWTGR